MRVLIIALSVALELTVHSTRELGSPNKFMTPRSDTPAQTSTPQTSRIESQVPKGILDPILKEAAKRANVPPQELVIVRAEAVVWNDGSLGCPEPGWIHTSADQRLLGSDQGSGTYDFRVDRGGSFRLCPEGRGHPPLSSDTR